MSKQIVIDVTNIKAINKLLKKGYRVSHVLGNSNVVLLELYQNNNYGGLLATPTMGG